MNNSQVAHVWAQQSKESGKGSNFFFEGETIYSYGYHFPIARFIDNNTVLMTTRGYSVTTSQHIGYVGQALPGWLTLFRVNDPSATDQRKNYHHMTSELQYLLPKIAKAKSKRQDYIDEYNAGIDSADRFSKFFKLGYKKREYFHDELPKKLEARNKRAAAADKRKREKARKLQEERARQDLQLWINGERRRADGGTVNHYNLHILNEGNYLREKNADTAETNQGAEVPLEHCVKAWPIIKKIVASGQEFRPNGKTIHLGHFSIDHISASGTVKAGCHTFKYSELLRFAKVLGLEKC